MYYMDDLSQQEIADMLDISRPTISRALAEARDKGIIEITVNSPVSRNYDLEKKLLNRYNLEEAIVIPVFSTQEESITKKLGEAGANYFYENIKDGMIIGLSIGKTLNEMAKALSDQNLNKRFKYSVVPIVGGTGYIEPQFHSNEICRKVAEAYGGVSYPIYAPAIAENEDNKKAFMKDLLVKRVFEKTLEADIIFVGTGNVNSSTLVRIGNIKKEEAENLKKKGIVGDIGSWFFDENGKFPDVDINKRIVGVSFDKLRRKSKIVLIAGTEKKENVIKSALKGNWVDVLITDENVCRYLLEND